MLYTEEAKKLTQEYLQRDPDHMQRMGAIRLYLQRNGSNKLRTVPNIVNVEQTLLWTNSSPSLKSILILLRNFYNETSKNALMLACKTEIRRLFARHLSISINLRDNNGKRIMVH